MRLLVDQNVPDSIAVFLRERGHEVLLVREVRGRAVRDGKVVRIRLTETTIQLAVSGGRAMKTPA